MFSMRQRTDSPTSLFKIVRKPRARFDVYLQLACARLWDGVKDRLEAGLKVRLRRLVGLSYVFASMEMQQGRLGALLGEGSLLVKCE